MLTSLAPSPIARQIFFLCLTNFTSLAFCLGVALAHITASASMISDASKFNSSSWSVEFVKINSKINSKIRFTNVPYIKYDTNLITLFQFHYLIFEFCHLLFKIKTSHFSEVISFHFLSNNPCH